MSSFHTTRRVEFAQTDAAGIMHFAAFFPLVESVEHEFLRSLGLSVMTSVKDGHMSWPRVAAHCDYQQAVRFEDVLDIELQLTRIGDKSLTYEYRLRQAQQPVATATITAVCCLMQPGQAPVSMSIPQSWRDLLGPYLKSTS
jgi:4-hydroxybenzoyl-CoA thioesterase/acyl-CoA thioester hydrolase